MLKFWLPKFSIFTLMFSLKEKFKDFILTDNQSLVFLINRIINCCQLIGYLVKTMNSQQSINRLQSTVRQHSINR